MNDKPNNVFKAIRKLAGLSILIGLPLFLVLYYEAWNLQLKDFEEIKKDVKESLRNLKERKISNKIILS
jgi:hypothetical protein